MNRLFAFLFFSLSVPLFCADNKGGANKAVTTNKSHEDAEFKAQQEAKYKMAKSLVQREAELEQFATESPPLHPESNVASQTQSTDQNITTPFDVLSSPKATIVEKTEYLKALMASAELFGMQGGGNHGQKKKEMAPAPCFNGAINLSLSKSAIQNCPQIGSLLRDLQKLPLGHADRPKKILLVGPAGTGKTTLGQAIARECNYPCHVYKASMIGNTYQNSGSLHMQEIFKKHAESDQPCVILVDELQALIRKHNNSNDSDNSSLITLWSLLDLYRDSKILFIGILNYEKDTPSQIIDRFQGSIINVDLPNLEQRKTVIKHCIDERNNDFVVGKKCLSVDLMAQRTAGLSCRNLEDLVKKMGQMARIQQAEDQSSVANGEQGLPQVHIETFVEALNCIKDDATKTTRKVGRLEWLGDNVLKALPYVGLAVLNRVVDKLLNKAEDSYNNEDPVRDRAQQRENSNRSLQLQETSLEHQKFGLGLQLREADSHSYKLDHGKAAELGFKKSHH